MRRPTPLPTAPGQESVWAYPRPPALVPSSAHVVVLLGGVVVCDTRRALRVLETSHPPSWYLPYADWVDGSLRASASGQTSQCEWKGQAGYLDVLGGGLVAQEAAWSYEHPVERYADLAGHVSVYPARMDLVTVDGEVVQAQAGGFYGGWVTADVAGPFKGEPGSWGW